MLEVTAPRRAWAGLAVLALPTLLVGLDATVLHLAVPALSAALKPSGAQLLWIVDVYGFLIAGSLITMGTLGDRVGRRRLLLIGGAAFACASVLAAFSTSAEMLIATRALLGIAGATLMPSTMALIRTMFPDERRRKLAIGVWITSFMTGAALGPLLGGLLLEHFWWGSVFLLGVPVMVPLLLLGPVLLPEHRDPDAGRLDLTSTVLSLGAVLAIVHGLKSGLTWTAGLAVAAGIVLGVVFLRRQGKLRTPLLDVALLRMSALRVALGAQTFAILAMAGAQFFIGQYLQLVLGLSPLEAGLWTLPATLAGILGTMLVPMLHLRPAYAMGIGLLVAAGGLVWLTLPAPSLITVVGAYVVIAIGFGPTMTLTTDLIVGSAPPARAGAASALAETGSELGTALGIAVLGSIGTAVYRAEAPPEAGDTLGAALSAGRDVVVQAQTAFTHGLQLVVAVSAVLVTVVAVTVMRKLPTRPGA